MPEEPIETATGLQEAYLIELLSIGGLSGSPVFTYLGGLRREYPIGGELNVTARAGAIHLLRLVHGHWNLASEERVDAVHDALDGGERVNMGIAIVVPITRLLEILITLRYGPRGKRRSSSESRRLTRRWFASRPESLCAQLQLTPALYFESRVSMMESFSKRA